MVNQQLTQDQWWFDKNAKSLAYFSLKKSVAINKRLIEELKKISRENGNVNARLCLHGNPNEDLHDMVILQYKDKTCRKPHKHLEKNETLHIIEGEMLILLFDEEGKSINKTILNKNNFAYRTSRNQYHLWLPLTEYVIYREIKQGPFKQEDNILPKWSHIEALKQCVDFIDLTCYNSFCRNPCSLNNKSRHVLKEKN